MLGRYPWCSYSVRGTGRFFPGEGTCRRDQARAIAAVVRAAHPYEDVVVDLYPLLTDDGL